MAYEDMTPSEIATQAAALLRGAGGLLGQLHVILSEAHNYVAHLYLDLPDGDDADTEGVH